MLSIQEIDVFSLRPWQDNPRFNEKAVNAVAESIRVFGFNVPILCDQNFIIIAGHTRWMAAKQIGMKSVPAIVLDINESQRKALAIADNKTAEIAEWNYPKLQQILGELRTKKINLPSLGYSQAELQALLTKQRDFNWKIFEDRLKERLPAIYMLFPVKVQPEMKELFYTKIKELASQHGITDKDFAKVAGKVIGLLLGI
jgi:hypothetical protein